MFLNLSSYISVYIAAAFPSALLPLPAPQSCFGTKTFAPDSVVPICSHFAGFSRFLLITSCVFIKLVHAGNVFQRFRPRLFKLRPSGILSGHFLGDGRAGGGRGCSQRLYRTNQKLLHTRRDESGLLQPGFILSRPFTVLHTGCGADAGFTQCGICTFMGRRFSAGQC